MAGFCSSCGSKCYLICDEDLIAGVTPLHQNLPTKKRESVIYQAQVDYVHGLLGDCLAQICQDIENSLLDTEAEDYIALDSEWQFKTLMQDYITPLVTWGASLIYIQLYGFKSLELDLPAREEREDYVTTLEGRVNQMAQDLQTYLATNGASFEPACNCPSEKENESADTLGGSFSFITAYPDYLDEPTEYRCSCKGACTCANH